MHVAKLLCAARVSHGSPYPFYIARSPLISTPSAVHLLVSRKVDWASTLVNIVLTVVVRALATGQPSYDTTTDRFKKFDFFIQGPLGEMKKADEQKNDRCAWPKEAARV